jgi:LmbE family N-acetylglucosaminyl deacetylase
MRLNSVNCDIYVPDALPLDQALARVTHVGIGAHPDDLEILAFPAISECCQRDDAWFAGIVVCDGAGSPRAGEYGSLSDAEMVARRRQEQRDAAQLGRYGVVVQLGYGSTAVKSAEPALVDDLVSLLQQLRADSLYMHSPADAHATHRATLAACISALRTLPPEKVAEKLYGVEVWRSLDWLPEQQRIRLPISDPDDLQSRLLRCHDSQIRGGKRYDLAIPARQRANATLSSSDRVDEFEACSLAMDLRPLIDDPGLTARELLERCLEQFSAELLDSRGSV